MSHGGTLQLLVQNAWVVETLKALGSGHMLHLSYADHAIEPATLASLMEGTIGSGTEGEIVEIGMKPRRVATFELQRVNNLDDFIRLDFRLLAVLPFVHDGTVLTDRRYLCRSYVK